MGTARRAKTSRKFEGSDGGSPILLLMDRLGRDLANAVLDLHRPTPPPRRPAPLRYDSVRAKAQAIRLIHKIIRESEAEKVRRPSHSGIYLKANCMNAKLVGALRIPDLSAPRGYRLRHKKGAQAMDVLSGPISLLCPPCPLKGNGCYPSLLIEGHKLELACAGKSAEQVTDELVGEIHSKGIKDGRSLRLWAYGGDFLDLDSALKIRDAVASTYEAAGGGGFGYTRRWPQIPRAELGNLSMLASLNNPTELPLARERGYVPAIIVEEFPDGLNPFVVGDHEFIPCRFETESVPCTECRLCLDDKALYQNQQGIAFKAHGNQKAKAAKAVGLKFAPLIQLKVGGEKIGKIGNS